MPSTSRRPVSTLLLLTALAGTACGPFGYLKKVAKEANRTVADAKAAGAEEWAPYEYWGAVSYLEQSKVMMAYSEYERSFDYGERAKALADEAKRKTEMREKGKTSESKEGIARPEDDIGPIQKGAKGDGEVEGKAEGKKSKSAEGKKSKAKGKASVKVGGK